MSTPGPTPSPAESSAVPPGSTQDAKRAVTPKPGEIKLIGRSMLFYWWPVWVVAFICAAWTLVEDNRLAVLPSGGAVTETAWVEGDTAHPKAFTYTLPDDKAKKLNYPEQPIRDAVELSKDPKNDAWPTRISRHPLLGVIFVLTLLVVIFTTNVPLRGLWSFVVLLLVALVIVIISLVPGAWDQIFKLFARFLVYINMGAYLFIGGVVFGLWAVAFFIFDRRQFVIFSPGQIRVCEHIGDAVEAYSTVGVQLTKQRDDPFRHLLLGFGSSDLIIKFATGDRREVRIQNVLGLNFNIAQVEDMIRTVPS
jgi:hypothetical protein